MRHDKTVFAPRSEQFATLPIKHVNRRRRDERWVNRFRLPHFVAPGKDKNLALRVHINARLEAGATIETIFAWGLVDRSLDEFAAETAVSELWLSQEAGWKTAVVELQNLLNLPALAQFLTQLTRQPALPPVHISPNLLFPALSPVLAQAAGELHLLLPPPKAVGTSPPWPYREDPGWVLTQLAQALLPHLLAEKLTPLPPAQQTLLTHAATAVCLAAMLDLFESQAYVLRSKKLHNLPQLPQAVAQLERYLVGEDDLLLRD